MIDDSLLDQQPSRYIVGIDLGTTNCAVCYVDSSERPWRVRVLEIPQLVAPGQVESRDTLPSFHYQPLATESTGTGPRLPWSAADEPYVVGFLARDYGTDVPGRLISSAKSWLCHSGVDRTAELLPWHAASDVERISPIEASSRYLAHIRSAWNHRFRNDPLERQDIVLTLPASFDEIARELTVQAAARAQLARVVLIEEPQAAFYAWLYKHQDSWHELVSPGQKILVCDIGGGTTDFTLIRVRRGEGGRVQFHRVAVGDHLILGGDNMDLALARHVESRLAGGGKLQPRQWDVLLRVARQVKEQLLADNGPERATVSVPGAGSKLVGGSLQTHITREDVRQLLVEGFMPRVALAERPASRRSGFQEFGLPYAADSAMTRYLAAFLSAHRTAGDEEKQWPGDGGQESGAGSRGTRVGSQESVLGENWREKAARPDAVLFNGGVFASGALRQRLIDSLVTWFGKSAGSAKNATEGESYSPKILDHDRLDLAVARGAAYYGMVRRGEGVKIVASLARTYYIGIDSQPPAAVCLVPGSAEPGQELALADRQFDLRVWEPVEFPLFTSSVRLTDRPGDLVPVDVEQMTALPPIRTALKTKSRRERGSVSVQLHARLSEIGTVDLWCSEVGGERSWRLVFDVRSATQTDVAAHESQAESQGVIDEATAAACEGVLASVFAATGREPPDTLLNRLSEAIGDSRQEWPTSLLRRIWEMLVGLEAGRRKSPRHEARWLNLVGYSLRPGYGLAVDDWRVAETWKTVQGKLAHAAPTSRTESLILWRRIAGGLSAGQQRALAEPLLATVRTLHKRQTGGAGQGSDPTFSPHESQEVLRLLGSLELLAGEVKIELGQMLVELLPKKKLAAIRPAIAWAIGRIGAREPAYGPLNTVVPPAEAEAWAAVVSDLDPPDAMSQFALTNLARRTGDRHRDLADPMRERVVGWLGRIPASQHAIMLVREGGRLDKQELDHVFCESLPKGLRVR